MPADRTARFHSLRASNKTRAPDSAFYLLRPRSTSTAENLNLRREAQRSNNLESKDKCVAMLGVNFQFQAGAMLGCRGLGRLTLRPTSAEESPADQSASE